MQNTFHGSRLATALLIMISPHSALALRPEGARRVLTFARAGTRASCLSMSSSSAKPSTPSEWKAAKAADDGPLDMPANDDEWRRVLEPMQFAVLREEATEPKFSSEYNDWEEAGVFLCAGCAQPLFTTQAKYDSRSGWPSFYAPAADDSVAISTDFKAIVPRSETRCSRCGGHLGHVFDDGPPPSGKRYCMNGAALEFEGGTARAEAALANFAQRAPSIRPPPLPKLALETALSALLTIGLAFCFAVNLQAESGATWAIEVLRASDGWPLSLRRTGGPLTLVLVGLNGVGVLQKLPLMQEALRQNRRDSEKSDATESGEN